MAGTNDHIILKQTLYFLIRGKDVGFRFQKEISEKFWEEISPAMERIFDEIVGPDQVVQIEKLELDLGEIKKSELKETLIRKLTETLKDVLKGYPPNPSAGVAVLKSSVPVSRFQKWLYFLKHGHFQWTEVGESHEEFYRDIFQTLASDAQAVEEFRNLLSKNPLALDRLVLQHDPVWLKTLAEACAGQKLDDLLESWVELKWLMQDSEGNGKEHLAGKDLHNPQVMDRLFWKQVVEQIIIQNKTIPSVPQWFAGFLQTIFPPLSLSHLLTGWKQQLQFKGKPYQLISSVLHFLSAKPPNTPDNKSERIKNEKAEKGNKTADRTLNLETEEPRSRNINRSEQEISGIQLEKSKKDKQQESEAAANQDKNVSEPAWKKGKEVDPQDNESAPKKDPSEPSMEETLDQQKVDSLSRKRTIDQEDHHATDQRTEIAGKKTDHLQNSTSFPNKEPSPDIQKDNIPSNKEYPEGTEFYIKEAGMVLLHPFLSTFNNTCDLLEGKNFKNEAARGRAVLLLQYLATGETELPEYKLLLPKLLCDMPLELPLEKHLELSGQEAEEGESMLKAVINHWGALGNTSPEGLREGFILRDGKLSKRPNGWYLQVEQKTIDILLDRLPWNLSMIKLPWMKDILRVEWV